MRGALMLEQMDDKYTCEELQIFYYQRRECQWCCTPSTGWIRELSGGREPRYRTGD